MNGLLTRIASFFTAFLLLLGIFPGVDLKDAHPIPEAELLGVDVTNGYTVRVPASSGSARFNRVSFSYEASAPCRAVFAYRQGFRTVEEEYLLGTKEREASSRSKRERPAF